MRRWLVRLGVGALGLFGAYLLIANVLLNTGLVAKWVNGATHQVHVEWKRALTLYPGHARVTGFSMQFDDENMVQMDLRVGSSTVNMSFLPLLTRRRFVMNHGRASDVVYRMTTRVDEAEAKAHPERVAAYPRVPGYAYPPLKPKKSPGPPPLPADLEKMISIELNDLESDVTELWINEFRYTGPAHVRGSFAFKPMKMLQVGPASVSFEGGRLSAGEHVIFPAFEAKVRTTISEVELAGGEADAARILAALTASIHGTTRVEGLSVVSLYTDEVKLEGGGQLDLNVETVKGRVTPKSTLRLALDHLSAGAQGMGFKGRAAATAAVTEKGRVAVHLELPGRLVLPELDGERLGIELIGAKGDLVLSTTDLTAPPEVVQLRGEIAEARSDDAGPLVRAAAKRVPVIAAAVLGNGPLVAKGSVTVRPPRVELTLDQATLGAAKVHGGAAFGAKGWNAAAFGKLGEVPIGLRLVDTRLGYEPAPTGAWLEQEMKRCGLARTPDPESAPVPGPSRARKAPTASPALRAAGAR